MKVCLWSSTLGETFAPSRAQNNIESCSFVLCSPIVRGMLFSSPYFWKLLNGSQLPGQQGGPLCCNPCVVWAYTSSSVFLLNKVLVSRLLRLANTPRSGVTTVPIWLLPSALRFYFLIWRTALVFINLALYFLKDWLCFISISHWFSSGIFFQSTSYWG